MNTPATSHAKSNGEQFLYEKKNWLSSSNKTNGRIMKTPLGVGMPNILVMGFLINKWTGKDIKPINKKCPVLSLPGTALTKSYNGLPSPKSVIATKAIISEI